MIPTAQEFNALKARVKKLEDRVFPKLTVGLDAGTWGPQGAADVKGCVGMVRYDMELGAPGLALYAGLKILLLVPGPYNKAGVSALNADQWVAKTLAFYKANLSPQQAPYLEVLNEPGGSWFWGNPTSPVNTARYVELLSKTHAALYAEYGANAPKIIASVDTPGVFGKAWWTPACAEFVDLVSVHPYGGTGSKESSALGDRKRVEEAHALTGKPVAITEVGWPTAVGQPPTGDSLQWSEPEQAANLKGFLNWAASLPYVPLVIYFNYRDFGSNNWYGVVRNDGTHKASYDVLATF